MHGSGSTQIHDRRMAKNSELSGRPSPHGLSQRTDSSGPLVASGTQHGAGMGNSPQPSASERHCPSQPCIDMESVDSSKHRKPSQQDSPGQTRRLAQMGEEPGQRREPLHPQGQTPVVEKPALQGPVSVGNVLRLLEQQDYRCALTGRKLTPQTTAIDHMIPIRSGGEHTIENAQVLHKDVNRAKGSLTTEDFVAMCCEIVNWSSSTITRKDSP